jgi:antitoxin VapB
VGISIRNREAGELARKLAELRKTNMTEAIIHALRSELKRERDTRPLEERLEDLANETMAMARPGGRVMTKDEIDQLWGQ